MQTAQARALQQNSNLSRTAKATRGCCQELEPFERCALNSEEGSERVDRSEAADVSSYSRADATPQTASLVAEPCCNCLELIAIRNGRFWQIDQCSSVPLRIELIGCRLAFERDYDCDIT